MPLGQRQDGYGAEEAHEDMRGRNGGWFNRDRHRDGIPVSWIWAKKTEKARDRDVLKCDEPHRGSTSCHGGTVVMEDLAAVITGSWP
ncbi:hypothetical protein E2542_SST03704 [Spatholobus suberectus]|nr:hypothetical protein E2542_SST03704 [Spatholobus suberectus]